MGFNLAFKGLNLHLIRFLLTCRRDWV